MSSIYLNFPITSEEYKSLEKKFGQLCYYAAWQLTRKNSNNNHQCDLDDFQQELMLAVLRAGSYYKRQVYIDSSFSALFDSKMDKIARMVLEELFDLWKNRTRHGANRQKFGDHQEKILDNLCECYLRDFRIPDKKRELIFDFWDFVSNRKKKKKAL